MKAIAKFLTGIVIVVALAAVYYIVSSKLPMRMEVSVVPASVQKERFSQITQEVSAGLYDGVSALDDINEYSFVTIIASASNFSPFTAEWTQLSPKRLDGDLLICETDAGPKDIPPFQTGDLSVTILTKNDSADRSGWLEYYIFGRFHSILAESAIE